MNLFKKKFHFYRVKTQSSPSFHAIAATGVCVMANGRLKFFTRGRESAAFADGEWQWFKEIRK